MEYLKKISKKSRFQDNNHDPRISRKKNILKRKSLYKLFFSGVGDFGIMRNRASKINLLKRKYAILSKYKTFGISQGYMYKKATFACLCNRGRVAVPMGPTKWSWTRNQNFSIIWSSLKFTNRRYWNVVQKCGGTTT